MFRNGKVDSSLPKMFNITFCVTWEVKKEVGEVARENGVEI